MLLDLAAVVDQRTVERVIGEAVDRGTFDLWPVNDQLDRNPKHPGTERGLLIRADFAWPQAKFNLETDGGRYHNPEHHRRRDYRRDQRLKRAHWEVRRVGDDQLNAEPDSVVTIVWELLAPRLPPELRRPWP